MKIFEFHDFIVLQQNIKYNDEFYFVKCDKEEQIANIELHCKVISKSKLASCIYRLPQRIINRLTESLNIEVI